MTDRDKKGRFVKGSKVNQGRVPTKAQRKTQSVAMSGRALTEGHKEKIRLGMRNSDTQLGIRPGTPAWNKGISIDCSHLHTEEVAKKISKALKGKKHPDDVRKKISATLKKLWRDDPEIARKCLVINSPNKCEKRLRSLLNKMYPGEWRFVGDGKVVIEGKCPDFINVNGQKKIIELFGERWHEPPEEQERIEFFKQYGYDTLVLWVKQLNNENLAKEKIADFYNRRKQL